MKQKINWGILGPGKIAHKFADAFKSVGDATLLAIASRDTARGQQFAAEFGAARVYGNYQDLVSDPAIDAVYIATPHPYHYKQTLLCLEHGKAVVCEKPLTTNYADTGELISLARRSHVFLMEGMWSRFFPATLKAYDLVRSGAIGKVRYMRADFGFMAPYNPASRVFNLELAGGAQLDVGVYPMFLALLLLGQPGKIQAAADLAETGADASTSVQFEFAGGALAQIFSSVTADSPKQADIVGDKGTLTMHTPWHKSQRLTLAPNGAEPHVFDFPFTGFGFEYELAHATACLREDLKESPLMPLDLSLTMAMTADEILRQCGVRYPDFRRLS